MSGAVTNLKSGNPNEMSFECYTGAVAHKIFGQSNDSTHLNDNYKITVLFPKCTEILMPHFS